MTTDDDILAALPSDRSWLPISVVARRLRMTARKLHPLVRRLASQGRIVLEVRGTERWVRLDGETAAEEAARYRRTLNDIVAHALATLGGRP